MMATSIAFLLVHTTSVQMYVGVDSSGAQIHAAAVDLPCFVDRKRRMVRDSTGEQVVSESTIFYGVDSAAILVPGSRVLDPRDGRESTIITMAVRDMPGYPTPDHVEVTTT